MEENIFWLRIWQTAAVVIVGVALTISGCVARQNTAVERLVKGGVDAQEASCAIRGDEARSGVCAILAANK